MAGYIIVAAEKEQKRKTGEEDGKRVTGNATKRYSWTGKRKERERRGK